jgi:hypothetical protein
VCLQNPSQSVQRASSVRALVSALGRIMIDVSQKCLLPRRGEY